MFRSQMYLLPQHKLGVVVLANSDSATGVVDHIATEALSLALEAKTGIRQPEHSKTGWSNEPLSAQTLQDFAGDYTTLAGAVKISTDSKVLRAEAAGHSFNLRQRSDGLLGLDYALLGLISVDLGTLNDIGFSQRTIAGRKLLVARIGAQEMLVGQRIEPPASLGAWQQRLGDYDITNLDGDAPVVKHIRLTQERGFMFVELTSLDESGLPPRTVLMPVSDSEALLLGSLAGSGETVRSVSINGVAQLAYSGYLAKKK